MALYRGTDYERALKGPNPTGKTPSEPYRTEFRRDYGRLIHCAAFRRLVGKTQLFPGSESDFFRNRLTHSIEVAQIAKSIALKLNYEHKFLQRSPIDLDLVEVAGLAHDLGHPPFGHNGELALDRCMIEHGGFEGNAQTLRIVSILEKKATADKSGYGVLEDGTDQRRGLDLCLRTLAAILKYDEPIPDKRDKATHKKAKKGYYASEALLVDRVKKAVIGDYTTSKKFKTVECHIMDLADDIAYSTYDLEDAFKAGFLSPLDLLSADNSLLRQVSNEITDAGEVGPVTPKDVRAILLGVFETYLQDEHTSQLIAGGRTPTQEDFTRFLFKKYLALNELGKLGYVRTGFTSNLVGEFIGGVKLKADVSAPPLSVAYMNKVTRLKVEVLIWNDRSSTG